MRIVLLARRLRGGPPGDLSESQGASESWGVCDQAALAAALSLRQADGRVAVITAGPLAREESFLREALARGADHAVCVSDAALETMDYYGVARVLAAAVKRVGFDLVLCGDRSEDEGQGAIGPAVAEWLAVPHLTGVIQPRLSTNGSGPGVTVTHRAGRRVRDLTLSTPALLAIAYHEAAPGEVTPGAGTVESVALDALGLNAAELKHRDDCLGRTLPIRNVRNATLVEGPAELVARLRGDRLL